MPPRCAVAVRPRPSVAAAPVGRSGCRRRAVTVAGAREAGGWAAVGERGGGGTPGDCLWQGAAARSVCVLREGGTPPPSAAGRACTGEWGRGVRGGDGARGPHRPLAGSARGATGGCCAAQRWAAPRPASPPRTTAGASRDARRSGLTVPDRQRRQPFKRQTRRPASGPLVACAVIHTPVGRRFPRVTPASPTLASTSLLRCVPTYLCLCVRAQSAVGAPPPPPVAVTSRQLHGLPQWPRRCVPSAGGVAAGGSGGGGRRGHHGRRGEDAAAAGRRAAGWGGTGGCGGSGGLVGWPPPPRHSRRVNGRARRHRVGARGQRRRGGGRRRGDDGGACKAKYKLACGMLFAGEMGALVDETILLRRVHHLFAPHTHGLSAAGVDVLSARRGPPLFGTALGWPWRARRTTPAWASRRRATARAPRLRLRWPFRWRKGGGQRPVGR